MSDADAPRGDEWIVADRMHAPSAGARKEVGEAVSRAEVKVTVAIPKRHAPSSRKGSSYHPAGSSTRTA